jgi:hypothetical protein
MFLKHLSISCLLKKARRSKSPGNMGFYRRVNPPPIGIPPVAGIWPKPPVPNLAG